VPPDKTAAVRRAKVEEDRQQEEEPGEHVAALGDPGHRLHPQGMNREDEGREGRAHAGGHALDHARGRLPGGAGQKSSGDEVEADGIGRVEQEIAEVVAPGIHAAQGVVDSQGEPGQGNPVAEEGGREHVAKLRPAESPIALVHQEVRDVVPVEELTLKRREKGQAGRERDAHGPEEPGRCH
jgi:hypothetical protein